MRKARHFFMIAADPLVRLWPVSSAKRSFSFVRGADGLSPVERLLRAIRSTNPDSPVTLITSQNMLQDAKCALQEAHITRYKIVLVESLTSYATLTTFAATLAAHEDNKAELVVLPGNLLAASEKRLADTVNRLAKFDDEDGKLFGALATRFEDCTPGKSGTFFAASMNGRADWMPVENTQHEGKQKTGSDWANKNAVSLMGPLVARPQSLLNLVSQTAPLVTQACANAIAMAKQLTTDVIIPKSSFLSLVRETKLEWIFQKHIENLRVLPVEEANVSAASGWENRLALEFSATDATNKNVLAAGYDNFQRIDFDGQTLLLNPGHERDVCFPSQATNIMQEPDRAIFAPIYSLLTSGDETEAWLLNLPADTATQRECHFTRTEKLTVLDGAVSVRVENEVFKLFAGHQVNISPGMAHILENHGDQPARLLEMRTGKILNDDDRLYVPDSRSYKTVAA